MSKIVIDVSAYNGVVDWKKVKAAGVDAAILKVIRKDLLPDKRFEANWEGCKAAEMPLAGVYNYSYATSVAKARTDAQKVLDILAGRKVKVWLDVEDACLKGKGKTLIAIINAYGDVITAAGYEFGVYTGLSFFNTHIKPYGDLNCSVWIARYPSSSAIMSVSTNPPASKQPLVSEPLEGWQYTSKGRVAGIAGNVDLNEWYGAIPEPETVGNPYPIPERILKLKPVRMRGDDVAWTQYHLVRLGFLADKNAKGKSSIDRIYGPATSRAVEKAQKHFGTDVDGIVGANTIYVLRWN